MEWLKNLSRFLWEKELNTKDEYFSNWQHEKNQVLKLGEEIIRLEKELNSKLNIISSQQEELELATKWDNHYKWKKYMGSFETISGLRIPPNTFIDANNKDIKKLARGMSTGDIRADAIKTETYYNRRTNYYFDHQNSWHPSYIEYFQTASFTFASKKGDCDDFAILFASHMHCLGHGDKVIVCCGVVTGVDGEEYGHAWNKVLIDGVWTDYDSQAGVHRKNIVYPKLEDCWFWFNYYDNFQA